MFTRVTTFAISGVDPQPVWVEVDVRAGLPAFAIVGLGDAAVREARERVRAAIQNAGFEFPQRRIVVNLAPADVRKAGPGFDLAVAAALLAASGQLPAAALEGCAVLGELSLDGDVRPCRGALVAAEGVRRWGLRRLVVPAGLVAEAALVEGIDVVGVGCLGDLAAALAGDSSGGETFVPVAPQARAQVPDLADVRGHLAAIRALEIAAAGGHNVLLQGPPGSGKTMLARRLPGILPPLSRREALEVTRIHSVAGLHDGRGLIAERPFRAPHHTTSAVGLVGGRVPPVPGEVSLAHNGVLFLDELSEFTRTGLEALRQPVEDGEVTIVRGPRALVLPSAFMLVAATNPCPCGLNASGARCRCDAAALERHARRLSGPLLDRIDIHVTVERPEADLLAGTGVTSTAEVRERVLAARAIQVRRGPDVGGGCNARLAHRALRAVAALDDAARRALRAAYEAGAMSARGHDRVLRVARTIADLDGAEGVSASHVREALSLRSGGAPVAAAA